MKIKTKEQKLTELIDLHYGEDKAVVRHNIRLIATEYAKFIEQSKKKTK